jgi:hypothetical protein
MTENEDEAENEQRRNLVAYRQKDRAVIKSRRSITIRYVGSLILTSLFIICIYIPPLVILTAF